MEKHKYCCQNTAQNYLDHMIPVPDDFNVNPDCLSGVERQDFISGLKDLTDIIKEMYVDMIKDPSGYGLPLVEDIEYRPFNPKAAESKNSSHRLIALLHVLANSGEFPGGEIIVNKQSFSAACKELNTMYKISNSNMIFQKLCDFGFTLTGFNGKGFDKKSDTFAFSHPDERVIRALYGFMKNARLHKDAMMSFNYFLAVSPEDLPENQHQIVFAEYLSGREREFYERLNAFMDEKGFFCKDDSAYRFTLGYFFKPKDKQYFMRCYSQYGKLFVCFKLNCIDRYTEYVEKQPERVKQMFRKNSNCRFCQESCGYRRQWTFEGNTVSICNYGFHFDIDCYEPEDLDYYEQIILYEMEGANTGKKGKRGA